MPLHEIRPSSLPSRPAPADSPSSTSPADGAAQGGEVITWDHGIRPEELGELLPEVRLIGFHQAADLVPGSGMAARLYTSPGIQRAGLEVSAARAAAALHLPSSARGGVYPFQKGETEASRLGSRPAYGRASVLIWSCPFQVGEAAAWVHGLEVGRGRDFATALLAHLSAEPIGLVESSSLLEIALLRRGPARWSYRQPLRGELQIFDAWAPPPDWRSC